MLWEIELVLVCSVIIVVIKNMDNNTLEENYRFDESIYVKNMFQNSFLSDLVVVDLYNSQSEQIFMRD